MGEKEIVRIRTVCSQDMGEDSLENRIDYLSDINSLIVLVSSPTVL